MLEEKYGSMGQPIPEHTRIAMELGVSEAEARQIMMDNVQATRRLASIPPLAPGQARVTIPVDNTGNMVSVFMSDGNHCKCPIPPGAQPGQQVVVQLPPGLPPGIHAISEDPHPHSDGHHMYQVPPVPVPVAPPLGPTEARVTVPPGHTGTFIPVRMSDGATIKTKLPPGAQPGQQVVVQLPPGLPRGVVPVSEAPRAAAPAPVPVAPPLRPNEARVTVPPGQPIPEHTRIAMELGVSEAEARQIMMDNVQATRRLASIPPLAPGQARVTIPVDNTGNMVSVFMSDGNHCKCPIPPGAQPGQQVVVQLPPGLPPGIHAISEDPHPHSDGHHMYQVPPVPVPVAPPLGPTEARVTVPPGHTGTFIPVRMSDGATIKTKLPPGAQPGQQVVVQLPPGLPRGVVPVSEAPAGAAAFAPPPFAPGPSAPSARPAGPGRTASMQLAGELGVTHAEARLIINENNQAEQALHHQPPPPADPITRLAQEMGVSREEAQRMMAENSQAASQLHSAPALGPGEALVTVPPGLVLSCLLILYTAVMSFEILSPQATQETDFPSKCRMVIPVPSGSLLVHGQGKR